jgi:hypothetical protein
VEIGKLRRNGGTGVFFFPKSSVSDSFRWLASSAEERAKYSAVVLLERWWKESAQLSLWVFPPIP